MEFNGTIVETPSVEKLRKVRSDYEAMLISILKAVLDRHDAHPDYPFIDTKLNLITGVDFGERGFKGRETVYGWIQGRGLESLAGHARWLPRCSAISQGEKEDLIARTTALLGMVFNKMEAVRAHNGGHVSFAHSTDGVALATDDAGNLKPTQVRTDACSITDVFYAKGLLAAASLLGIPEKVAEAAEYFSRCVADVKAERLYSDQQPFDPKNRVQPIPGRRAQAPWMLCLGGFPLFARDTGEPVWLDRAAEFTDHIVKTHVNRGQLPDLQPYDFFEAVDETGRPWRDERGILSDSGHALEFVGLAAKCLLAIRKQPAVSAAQRDVLARCAALLPRVLVQNFGNGWNARAGGIFKAFDLVSRKPINGDLPWWSLPETMRAAVLCRALAADQTEQPLCLDIAAKCSNAFLTKFVNRNVHLMAYQTRDENGRPIDVIPATPDADPGYHTGLSIMDFLDALDEPA